ncbi:MAG: ADP-forming succinate--CoA ligase subunit beta [Planctomycetota bacterium]
MYIHEHQAKALLGERGVTVPAGRTAMSPAQAGAAFDALHGDRAVVKAQVHAGGRGEAGGIRVVGSRAKAEAAASDMLGTTLVTRQTGRRGRDVHKVLVEEALDLQAELYLSISLERTAGLPLVIASSRGGVAIEELAATEPEAILREYGNPFTGLDPFQARKLLVGLDLPREQMRPLTKLVLALGETFVELDCSLIELNPLALCGDGRLVAADVKMSFDDNALSRHPELADLRDTTQEDPREVEAERYDLSYVGLDGAIGCMVNGAGLAMATMDLIRLHGGEPANFLDVGGAATAEKVTAAFRLICQDEAVQAILVNIFGGIVKCDLIATGILQAVEQTDLQVPLVVRLEGTNAEQGRAMLAESDLSITSAASLDEAAANVVELAKAS